MIMTSKGDVGKELTTGGSTYPNDGRGFLVKTSSLICHQRHLSTMLLTLVLRRYDFGHMRVGPLLQKNTSDYGDQRLSGAVLPSSSHHFFGRNLFWPPSPLDRLQSTEYDVFPFGIRLLPNSEHSATWLHFVSHFSPLSRRVASFLCRCVCVLCTRSKGATREEKAKP
jgi:hypothetical protein